MACLTDRSVDGVVYAAARTVAHASRQAERLARRLTRVSLRRMVRGGSGVLPDGSLVALRRRIRFETGPASCPTARSWRFGGGSDGDVSGVWSDGSLTALWRMIGSRRARCLARRLARGALAEDSIRDGPGVTLGLSRNRSVRRIKGNQATFDNSQRNNLRSCVWVSGVVLVRMFMLEFRRPGPRSFFPFIVGRRE